MEYAKGDAIFASSFVLMTITMNPNMKIVGLGNALADVLTPIRSDRVLETLTFERGGMYLVDHAKHVEIARRTAGVERTIVSGGSAANTVRGLARLGLESAYIGKVGEDEVGRFLEEEFREYGVTPFLLHASTPTGRCMVLVSSDGERTMATYLGAAVELTDDDLLPSFYSGYDLLHIEGYLVQNHALIAGAIRKARKAGLKVSLDMASFNVVEENLEFLQGLVAEGVDILFANEEEARSFTGREPADAVREMARMCEVAIVKIGDKGSLVAAGETVYSVAARPADVVDTTGAGDLYASGFLFGLSRELPLETCGRIGSLVAAEVIAEVGPAIPEEKWPGIRQRMADILHP